MELNSLFVTLYSISDKLQFGVKNGEVANVHSLLAHSEDSLYLE